MRRLVVALGLIAMLGSSATADAALIATGREAAPVAARGYKNNKVDAEIEHIARAERGRDQIYVRVAVTKADMRCVMRVRFEDGSVAQPPRVTSDANGICILHFDVPNRPGVVGPALMKIDILNKRGQERAKLVQDFAVYDRSSKW